MKIRYARLNSGFYVVDTFGGKHHLDPDQFKKYREKMERLNYTFEECSKMKL